MSNIILIIQILTGILLSGSILMQNQSGGLGGAFGGGASYHTKRGVEKGLHYATIALSIVFTATSLISLI